MKLLVICGHGAGDPGACGNGYQEAERVRALGKRIKELGGDSVILADTNRNYYADNGITNLSNDVSDTQIIELHMDAANSKARGGHIIIKKGFKADAYDEALAKFIGDILPGRSEKIVHRSDISNVNRAASRGYGYRLAEIGFITNHSDVSIFNNKMDEIAKGILSAFSVKTSNVKPKPNKPKYSVDRAASEIYAGLHGNGEARRKWCKSVGLNYDEVQAKVNQLCGIKSNKYPSKKTNLDAVARAVIRGDYKNGAERARRLKAAGYDPDEVQKRVNELL